MPTPFGMIHAADAILGRTGGGGVKSCRRSHRPLTPNLAVKLTNIGREKRTHDPATNTFTHSDARCVRGWTDCWEGPAARFSPAAAGGVGSDGATGSAADDVVKQT